MSIALDTILACYHNMASRVRYKYGAKAEPLDQHTQSIDELDCSGFVRYVLDRAGIHVPDGSVLMHQWCEQHWRRLASPDDLRYSAQSPDRLFIAFLPPKRSTPGHVWLVYEGMTLECRGGAGVSSRKWNAGALRNAQHAYEVPV